jgi:hypothetical protein
MPAGRSCDATREPRKLTCHHGSVTITSQAQIPVFIDFSEVSSTEAIYCLTIPNLHLIRND